MTPQMGLLFSAIAFVGTHFLFSHPLRGPLIRGMGEKAFRGLYSLIALITLGSMIYYYRIIGREPPLWNAGDAGWIAGTLLCFLFAPVKMAAYSAKMADVRRRFAGIADDVSAQARFMEGLISADSAGGFRNYAAAALHLPSSLLNAA